MEHFAAQPDGGVKAAFQQDRLVDRSLFVIPEMVC